MSQSILRSAQLETAKNEIETGEGLGLKSLFYSLADKKILFNCHQICSRVEGGVKSYLPVLKTFDRKTEFL